MEVFRDTNKGFLHGVFSVFSLPKHAKAKAVNLSAESTD
jgi:hypothetical protein